MSRSGWDFTGMAPGYFGDVTPEFRENYDKIDWSDNGKPDMEKLLKAATEAVNKVYAGSDLPERPAMMKPGRIQGPYPPVIGLLGHARSGKDTVAGFLQALTGAEGYYSDALAENLKEALWVMGVPKTHLWGAQKEEEILWLKGWTGRRLMQRLAELMREHVDQDFWIKSMEYTTQKDPSEPWVITDIRHLNEARRVKEQGGMVVRVVRKDGPKLSGEAAQAVSETEQDSHEMAQLVDDVIENFGTVDELRQTVEAKLKEWVEKEKAK